MADKKSEKREYNIPLRKAFEKAPKYKRAKKAINTVKEFLMKHMKVDEVKLGKNINLKMWEHGIKNPPHHIKVTVFVEDGVAKAELVGFDYNEPTSKDKEVLEEKVTKKDSKKAAKEEVVEAKAEEVKDEAVEETEEKADKKEAKPKKAPAKKKTADKKEE